jgi:hypothetical protein
MSVHNKFSAEKGSSRILALISTILFMMLAWVVTHDYDPNAADKRNLPEIVKIASSEISQYALGLQTSLMRMKTTKIRRVEELSFQNHEVSGYDNPRCRLPDCEIFHPLGGGASYRVPDDSWLDEAHEDAEFYGEWIFPDNVCVKDLPDIGFQPCNVDGEDNEEVMMLLPFVRDPICEAININLGLQKKSEPIPVNRECLYDGSKFTGSFSEKYIIHDKKEILSGQIFGCVHVSSLECPSASDHNVFFFVLSPR